MLLKQMFSKDSEDFGGVDGHVSCTWLGGKGIGVAGIWLGWGRGIWGALAFMISGC